MYDVSFRNVGICVRLVPGNGPTRVNTIDKQLKNESFKKEDAEFSGENLIVRKLNVCFIK